jgi:hypothetical protein
MNPSTSKTVIAFIFLSKSYMLENPIEIPCIYLGVIYWLVGWLVGWSGIMTNNAISIQIMYQKNYFVPI